MIANDLFDSPSLVDALVIATLVARTIEKAEAQGGDVFEAIKRAIPALEKSAGAARAIGEHLAKASQPSELIRQARAAAAVEAAAVTARRQWSAKIENNVDVRNARAVVLKCETNMSNLDAATKAAGKVEP